MFKVKNILQNIKIKCINCFLCISLKCIIYYFNESNSYELKSCFFCNLEEDIMTVSLLSN